MWTLSHRTPLQAWVWWNFHFLCTSSPPPDVCLRTTLEPYSLTSWCSQDQRLTLDHHPYWFIVSGFFIWIVPEENTFSSHGFVWDYTIPCLHMFSGWPPAVCVYLWCTVCFDLLKMFPSVHLCRANKGWMGKQERRGRRYSEPEKCSLWCI